MIRGGAVVGALAASITLWLAACAPTQTGPLQPLVVGWERYFKLDWQVDRSPGRTLVWGHILNDWGLPARGVRVLVDGIGPGGELLGQELAWVGSLAPGMRAYYEVPVKTPAPAYRVSVFAFDWVLSDDFGRRRQRWR
ncbi:MAG: hypothetical protein ACREM3_27245 [Candidatus Rokuibacteriota bacterium]